MVLSNTILLTTPAAATPSDESDESGTTEKLVIRDEISQLIELVPTVPKLQRLETMLRGCEYDEGHERDDEGSEEDEGDERPVSVLKSGLASSNIS